MVVLPETVDYEIRRELIRGNKIKGLNRLDRLGQELAYASISSAVMRLAAKFWAEALNHGVPTADDKALDCDMILAAQARVLAADWRLPTIVATTNVRHLQMFVDAREWQNIDASRR